MKILEDGHIYLVNSLDGDFYQEIQFVKRVGEKYPGNILPAHPGTTIQELYRVACHRLRFVDFQNPCPETKSALISTQQAILSLEMRAARIHKRPYPKNLADSEFGICCLSCGHTGCCGECQR